MSSGPETQHISGSGETTVRDPLYVFVVSDLLQRYLTDEVADFGH
jgi:hypothetical protein